MTTGLGRPAWRALGYLLLGVASTALGLTAALAAVTAGALLAASVVGLRVVPPLAALLRAMAAIERWRCGLVLAERPRPPLRPAADLGGRDRASIALRDPALWRELAWLLVAFPLNLAATVLATAVWLTGTSLVTIPIWYRYLPDGRAKVYDSGGVAHGVVDSVPTALPWAAAGLVLVLAAGWLTRAAAAGVARTGAALLRATRNDSLRQRVAALAVTRAATVADRQRELHRIERDLHDGAQARLVAASADLGLADESFDDDPQRARWLVEHARDGVLAALAELRDLVRGIGPPVLRDRGLGPALEAVTAHSPIPVTLDVDLPRRPPETVEAAAYFVACEALTNAVKHSRAARVDVTVRQHGGACLVGVRDNGVGGAGPRGGGLSGLADRVAALDGQLRIDSPPGGPTMVEAVLPCGW
ncbi:sensor histidine kinase [Dactylosporangium sp. CA-092794]|uniref:sensor histidine kinase n=1 Tax=Dactylosporangium sp. CA-092794 TaxID=3239929 RepID=UPI003D8B0255